MGIGLLLKLVQEATYIFRDTDTVMAYIYSLRVLFPSSPSFIWSDDSIAVAPLAACRPKEQVICHAEEVPHPLNAEV